MTAGVLFYRELYKNKSGKICFSLCVAVLLMVAYSNGWLAAIKNLIYVFSSFIALPLLLKAGSAPKYFFLFLCLSCTIILESVFSQPDYLAWVSGSRNQIVPILMSLFINGLLLSGISRLNEEDYLLHFALIPATLLLSSSILMVSLSGIGAALILYCSLLLYLILTHLNMRIITAICLSILFVIAVGFNDLFLQNNIELKTKVVGLADIEIQTDRLLIWSSYIEQSNLIFGADYSGILLVSIIYIIHCCLGMLSLVFLYLALLG